ncbi:4Fe-4S binding protein [Anaerocellum diazotrophicum]|uniref:Ferredoxin n=1 Tax=Caldicellulosiruptor diazotrophicus TaxID=2806205 RepID=A0ABM7NJY9_9FIRM|nr:4Fe-4S binding protein [Caldicellulosiruptor diazotrophicus]BCS80418.1 ferredoxin [Caldicellulosiruptor diazotrophicus]
MTKRVMPTQILRFFIQLISFIFFPFSFAMLLSQIKSLYLAFLGKENFLFNQNFIMLIITLIITIFLGRFFCGWVCAFGSILEWVHFLGKKLFKKTFDMPKKLDNFLKMLKYLVLTYLIVIVWTFGKTSYADPWNAFDNLLSLNFDIKTYLPSFIFFAFVLILSLFVNRAHCRYFCPLGAIFNIISRAKLLFVKKADKNCGKCRICSIACPMGIDMSNVENYKGECIACVKCIESCPRLNIELNITKTKIDPRYTSAAAIAGVFSVASFFATSSVEPLNKKFVSAKPSTTFSQSIRTENNKDSRENQTESKNTSFGSKNSQATTQKSTPKIYKDGIYTGEGFGYRPGLVVQVIIKNDKITDIKIISHQETPNFAQLPFEIIPKEIIESQSTNVDIISGATRTSYGIIMAVEDALSKAKIENDESAQN